MSTASASKVDVVFGRWLDASELSSFHEKLLSNMMLQNVIRSITILDPERLFHEIESAVHELQRRTGEKIGSNAIIGLYVHLCCLVERLVTRNPIETYVGGTASRRNAPISSSPSGRASRASRRAIA